MSARAKISTFLENYAAATVGGDSDAVAGSYGVGYVESGPGGVAVWTIDDAYRTALGERADAMRGLGLVANEVEVLEVDDFAPDHHRARARWTLTFERDGEPIRSQFDISYLVRTVDKPEIIAYVSHEDELAVMRRDGVIAE